MRTVTIVKERNKNDEGKISVDVLTSFSAKITCNASIPHRHNCSHELYQICVLIG
jgi:hypothetical protein